LGNVDAYTPARWEQSKPRADTGQADTSYLDERPKKHANNGGKSQVKNTLRTNTAHHSDRVLGAESLYLSQL